MQRWRSTRSPEGGPWPAEQRAPASFLLALHPSHSAAHPEVPALQLVGLIPNIHPAGQDGPFLCPSGFDASDSVIKMFFVKDLASN